MTSPLITRHIRTACPWVACNIYISAGRPYYYPTLSQLLRETIQHCRTIRSESSSMIHKKQEQSHSCTTESNIVLVHAYVDIPYNRSSFHFAGRGSAITQVVSTLAFQALDRLSPLIQQEHTQQEEEEEDNGKHESVSYTSSTRHPLVGLVDHISILPLHSNISNTRYSNQVMTEAKETALSLANILEKRGVQVLKYGTAHPENVSLAMIRKTQTNFFQSGGEFVKTSSPTLPSSSSSSLWGLCTIGSPMNFVENVNIRLSSHCSQSMAQTLTRKLRSRNGGIPGVEALTLPYSGHRWEVACNLLQPHLGSMRDIEELCKEWEMENQRGGDAWIESIYRVGTTEEQCLQTLMDSYDEDTLIQYESTIMNRFQSYAHS